MTDKIAVMTTCDSWEVADRLSRTLVEKRLAACVNILPSATSVYQWQGKIERTLETLLIVKTRRGLFDAVSAEIARLHSYEIPEIIALPIVDGAPAYLNWIEKETQPS